MIYVPQRGAISRHLSGYVQASTDNPTGWRPDYKRLGAYGQPQDWKVAAARRDAAARQNAAIAHHLQGAARARNAMVDAHARGVASPRLSGYLSGIDTNAQMAKGSHYVFHFTYSGLGLAPAMTALAQAVAGDTNFQNPVAAAESGGVQVSFIYAGQGSSVGNAGSEMQNVINHWSLMGSFNQLLFASAEGGPAQSSGPAAGVTVFATSPDGTVIQFSDGSFLDTTTGITTNADGTVRQAGTSTPGAPQPAGFNLSNLFSGLGTGTLAMLGIGALLLLRE